MMFPILSFLAIGTLSSPLLFFFLLSKTNLEACLMKYFFFNHELVFSIIDLPKKKKRVMTMLGL